MSHHVIWAYSNRREDVLRYHGRNRGSAFVDYMCDLLASPARQSCQLSSLPGYTCMLQLQGDRSRQSCQPSSLPSYTCMLQLKGD
ncbi:unnamed protein product, partial [Closterium sp. NIES-53]